MKLCQTLAVVFDSIISYFRPHHNAQHRMWPSATSCGLAVCMLIVMAEVIEVQFGM